MTPVSDPSSMLPLSKTPKGNPKVIEKKECPAVGGVPNTILLLSIPYCVTGSKIVPLRDTMIDCGDPGKNESPPFVKLKIVLFPSKEELISSSFK